MNLSYSAKVMNCLIKFHTRNTRNGAENQFESCCLFLSAICPEKRDFSRTPHQLITRLIKVKGNVVCVCKETHSFPQSSSTRIEGPPCFFFFSLPPSYSLSLVRYRSQTVQALTTSEKREKIRPPCWIFSTKIKRECVQDCRRAVREV